MGFDYNTSRKQLVLPEYGRNIQMMVDYIKSIEDRTERNRLANAVVAVMGNLNPHLRDIADFKHKLWDHLAIIADFELDIDFPYDVPKPETFQQLPKVVPYGTHTIRYKHYGKSIELIIEAATSMSEGEEKDALVNIIANHMKKTYLSWNRDSVNDEVIINDLKLLSKGKLDLSKVKLNEAREIIGKKHTKKIIRKNKPY
jgi:hypothetical protein